MANTEIGSIDLKIQRRLFDGLVQTKRDAFVGDASLATFIKKRHDGCEGETSPVFNAVKNLLLEAQAIVPSPDVGSKPRYDINKPVASICRDRADQQIREAKMPPRARNVLEKIPATTSPLSESALDTDPVIRDPPARSFASEFRLGALRYTAFMIESEYIAWRRIETSVLARGGVIDEKMRDDPFVPRLVTAGVVGEDRKRFLIHPSRIQVVRIEDREDRGVGPDRLALIRAVQRLETDLFKTRRDVYDALLATGFQVKITRPSFETSMGVALSSGLGGLNIVVVHGKRPNWVITTTLPSFEYYKFVERAAVHSKPSATESLTLAAHGREKTPKVDVERILEDRPEIREALTEEALAIASRIHSGEERTYTLAELVARRDALLAEAAKLAETIAIREREIAEERARLEAEEAELVAKLDAIRARKAELE